MVTGLTLFFAPGVLPIGISLINQPLGLLIQHFLFLSSISKLVNIRESSNLTLLWSERDPRAGRSSSAGTCCTAGWRGRNLRLWLFIILCHIIVLFFRLLISKPLLNIIEIFLCARTQAIIFCLNMRALQSLILARIGK